MAIIKSYTDLEQSKKLAEILPLESADMFYVAGKGEPIFIGNKMVAYGDDDYDALGRPDVLCWSLAALFSILPDIHLKKYIYDGITKYYATLIGIRQFNSEHYDNPVDACYEMILKLNELNLL